MKIKQTILIFALIIGTGFLIIGQQAAAASCGGVETSIIDCPEAGSCPVLEGETISVNPYEGTNPGTDAAKIQTYIDNYHHKYGLCKNDVTPTMSAKDTGIWGILILIINIMTTGIGIVAVGGIVYGSILYASAGGSPENTKKAKTIITDIVIGLAAYALMYAFLNFIIPGGMFA